LHLKNIYKEKELDELATPEDFSVVQNEKLYYVDRCVVTKHLKNIFSDNELEEDSVCANFAHTA
jgi:hypothetical protein